jgi:hypothetical protein
MKSIHILAIVLTIFTLLWIYRTLDARSITTVSKEGYDSMDTAAHKQYVKSQETQYNSIASALRASGKSTALGRDSNALFGTAEIVGFQNYAIDNPFPLQGKETSLEADKKYCEAVKTADCGIFDSDPTFASKCGICLQGGTNSANNEAIGGLVLTKDDRDYYTKNKLKPVPTLGSCDDGMFVATKARCQRVTNQLACSKNSTFNQPNGCSQCYSDSAYYMVEPESISGYGKIYLYGRGILTYKQSGDSGPTTVNLSETRAIQIILAGPEFENTLTLNVKGQKVATRYSSSQIYVPGDSVIYNGGIYLMLEGTGAAGYAPDRPGDQLWKRPPIPESSYIPPLPPYIIGYLGSATSKGDFTMDLYPLVLSDLNTGRKPRINNSVDKDGVTMTKMVPAFGQVEMALQIKPTFTFVAPDSEEGTICSGSPFITTSASAKYLSSDPCYTKTSGPGGFSIECLQNVFLTNGCLDTGSGYPTDPTQLAKIMMGANGAPLTLNQIADKIYNMAIISSTGNDVTGNKMDQKVWSDTSTFCTGKAKNSPCDTDSKGSGPLSPDCITYLWDNMGESESSIGATFQSRARSLFATGDTERNQYCTRAGTMSPTKSDGTINKSAMDYWSNLGGVNSIKNGMMDLHLLANDQNLVNDTKWDAITKCYGITQSKVASSPPSVPNYASMTSKTIAQCSVPNCVDWAISRPGQSEPACGERVTIFGKPKFIEYNFSIPVGRWNTIDEIRKIPGNNGYTIYGGDGNVSMVFPDGCNLKLTINNGPNFSGPITLVFTKTCAESLSSGSCGQNPPPTNWTYAQSIKCERI